MEQAISDILSQYGAQLWLSAVTIIVTTFFMMWIRSLITDISNYLKVKSSSIGEQSIIIMNEKRYLVEEIRFRKVKLVNGDDIVFMPMQTWMNMTITVPRYRDGIDTITKGSSET